MAALSVPPAGLDTPPKLSMMGQMSVAPLSSLIAEVVVDEETLTSLPLSLSVLR